MKQPSASQQRPWREARLRVGAFTLVELLTVVAIIGILLGLVLPAFSHIWSQRNEAATENLLRGLLASARTQAIRNGERGLFFYVDEQGAQRAVFIEAEPPQPAESGVITERQAVNRFAVVPGKVYTVPVPFRVTPMSSLNLNNPATPHQPQDWPDQLARQRFPFDTGGADTPRYHRNVFAIIFGSRGELVPGRDVLVHDPDTDGDDLGDKTRLPVGDVAQWWAYADPQGLGVPSALDILSGVNPALFDMIVLRDGRAANFISVDGLLVYDDSTVENLTAPSVQSVLLRDGRPFYLSRNSGDVITGPKGGS